LCGLKFVVQMTVKARQFDLPIIISKADAGEGEEGFLYFEGYASTSTKDRHGDIIPASAWNEKALEAFRKNPIMLYEHSRYDVAGKFDLIEARDEGLFVRGAVDTEWHSANKVGKGILKALSVRFSAEDWEFDENREAWIAKGLDLREISIVSIPAAPDSVFSVEKSLGAEEYKEFKKSHLKKEDMNLLERAKALLAKLKTGDATDNEKAELKQVQAEIAKALDEGEEGAEGAEEGAEGAEEGAEGAEEGAEGAEEGAEEGASNDDTPAADAAKASRDKEFADLKKKNDILEAKLAKAKGAPTDTSKKGAESNPDSETKLTGNAKAANETLEYYKSLNL